MTYSDFLTGKRLVAPATGLAEPPALNPKLFPFQSDITQWALRRGRAAIWADCGLGKSWMALEWARIVAQHTGGNVLILTPLAVAQQFVSEGPKLGIDIQLCRAADHIATGVNVTNYDRLHKFHPEDFSGIVLDESSVLKDYTSATRNELVEAFARTPFKLACTATPAPNDHIELGNHAEFLGVMNRTEMLSMFFVHDGGSTQDWRLKGHAREDFWRWVCSWACSLRMPSDLGYSDDGFVLPALHVHDHVVRSDDAMARQAGMLFSLDAQTLGEQRAARRGSLRDRVKLAADMVNNSTDPWLVWCDLNDESKALAEAIPDAQEVTGSLTAEEKERRMLDFSSGRARVLVSKPSICGWGVNWQHCAHVAFVGLSHSFEAWYQAIRRTHRFGQRREVNCHVITSSAEGAVVSNLRRKQRDAELMGAEMVKHMAVFTDVKSAGRDATVYEPGVEMTVPEWIGREELHAAE